eukprot:4356579-Prymnesium_polylepis.2
MTQASRRPRPTRWSGHSAGRLIRGLIAGRGVTRSPERRTQYCTRLTPRAAREHSPHVAARAQRPVCDSRTVPSAQGGL